MRSSRRITLRWLATASLSLSSSLSWERRADAFADDGAFHPRLLQLEDADAAPADARRAASRWSLELVRRTSAPGKLAVDAVRPSSPQLLDEPLLIWQGTSAVPALAAVDVRHLREYLRLGGMLIVDDRDPERGEFGTSVRRELKRILPESHPVTLPAGHVLFKTFYLMSGPAGRVAGPAQLEAIATRQSIQVLLLQHDLLGALTPSPDGLGWAEPILPGGAAQREQAIRLAVNIAMYVLCSDYKDDQVHAPFVMRRRQRER